MEDEDEQASTGEQRLSGADLLRGRLRELVARVHELDPQVRADADDSVHDLRVTVRRLRSTLASYAPAFVAHETAPIRSELQWFGALLGKVREPEVQVQRLAELGDEGTLRARLVVEHRAVRAGLVASMEEPRYAALLARLDALAAEPPLTQAAQASAEELVRSGAHEDWRRLRDRVNALPTPQDGTFPEHLHDVRKSARRLQYLLESGRAVAGDDAARLRRRVTKFQRRLGDHQDATVTQELLAETGNGSIEAASVAAAVAAEFPTLWRRLAEGAAAAGATNSGDGR